jgi:hypothetical protein
VSIESKEDVRVRLRARADESLVRCAFCHDLLYPPESACSLCFTRLHVDCFADLARCPTLGCMAVLKAPSSPQALERVLPWAGVVVGMIFLVYAATPAGIGWSRCSSDGRRGATRAQLAGFGCALDDFQTDTGHYPDRLEDLRERPADTPGWKGPYMKKAIPNDAWDHAYEYRLGRHGPAGYEIASRGPDGELGTDDDVRPR